jgi:hypothetical protein
MTDLGAAQKVGAQEHCIAGLAATSGRVRRKQRR